MGSLNNKASLTGKSGPKLKVLDHDQLLEDLREPAIKEHDNSISPKMRSFYKSLSSRLNFPVRDELGFSLLEVMIAITLFAFFVTAFLVSQGYNVSDSALSEEQLMLQSLCERKINELVLDPPKFTNVTATLKETKTFEESEFNRYEYTLEIKKLTIPDFAQLFSQKDATTDEARDEYEGDYFSGGASKRNAALEKMVFNELKKNIEKVIWQARVTVTNKETKYNFTLSTFLTNYNEKIQLNIGF